MFQAYLNLYYKIKNNFKYKYNAQINLNYRVDLHTSIICKISIRIQIAQIVDLILGFLTSERGSKETNSIQKSIKN